MIFGTAITPDFVQSTSSGFGEDPLTGTALRREISRLAKLKKNDHYKEAMEEVNGMKDEWGTGVSSLVMLYNGADVPMTFRSDNDDSGHLWKYTYDEIIHPGQWSVFLHVKTSGTATGSCATIGYNVPDYEVPYVWQCTWQTPWSGSNRVFSQMLMTQHWAAASWASVHNMADNTGQREKKKTGVITCKSNVGNASSPLIEFQIYRNDAG